MKQEAKEVSEKQSESALEVVGKPLNIFGPKRGELGPYKNGADLKKRKPLRRWHEAVIDDMLAFPLSKLKERGERLGYSPAYISVLTNSDMFKAHYEARRREYTKQLDDSLSHKLAQAADKSMDLVLQKLETKRDSLTFKQLSDFALPVLDRLGYSASPSNGVNVNVDARQITVGSVTAGELQEARAALRAAENSKAREEKVTDESASRVLIEASATESEIG